MKYGFIYRFYAEEPGETPQTYNLTPFAGIILGRLSGIISASFGKHPGNSVVKE